MDQQRRKALIAKVRAWGFGRCGPPNPVVSLEDYFNGNDDEGSIGCNLAPHPGIQKFFETLMAIRVRPEVQDDLVEIREVEEDHPEMWPFADVVWILSSANVEEVSRWISVLQPDEVGEVANVA